MSVLRQLNLLGQQRVDVPHIRSLESSIAADFDVLGGRIIAGSKPLVVRGFTLTNYTAGTPAVNVQLAVADAILMNIGASEAGTFLWVPSNRSAETLDAATNARVTGGFTASQTNYIGLDLSRKADSDTSDLVQFLDANSLIEQPKTVPLARTLDYRIVISTVPFSAQPNLVPIAKIKTNSSNQIAALSTDVEDARNLAFRLGSGGDFPSRNKSFSWVDGRVEFNTITGSTVNQFRGGDKVIQSQKDWMDAVMTRIWEIGGGENWYSPTADRNVRLTRDPSPNVFTSTGENFEFVSSNLHWRGLSIVFENSNGSSVFKNTIADQLSNSAGLTDITAGQCIYVDLDRTQTTSLTAQKANLWQVGTPTIPGSRVIIAWCVSTGVVMTRDAQLPVNTALLPATTTAIGGVKLSRAASTPSTPIVISDTGGTIVATSGNTGLSVSSTSATGLIVNATSGAGVNVTSTSGAGLTIGATSASGLVVTTTTTGVGANITASGASTGLIVQGGSIGGVITAGSGGDGLQVTGGTTGVGVRATGGSTNAEGGVFTGGGTLGTGIKATGALGSGNNGVGGYFLAGGVGIFPTLDNQGIVVKGYKMGAYIEGGNGYQGAYVVAGPSAQSAIDAFGEPTGIGATIRAYGGTNNSSSTGPSFNPPVEGAGTAGVFIGSTGTLGGDGIQAWGRATNTQRTGIVAVGSYPTGSGIAGGIGGVFQGGYGSSTGNSNGGNGFQVTGGNAFGVGTPGAAIVAAAGTGGAGNQDSIVSTGVGTGAGIRANGGNGGAAKAGPGVLAFAGTGSNTAANFSGAVIGNAANLANSSGIVGIAQGYASGGLGSNAIIGRVGTAGLGPINVSTAGYFYATNSDCAVRVEAGATSTPTGIQLWSPWGSGSIGLDVIAQSSGADYGIYVRTGTQAGIRIEQPGSIGIYVNNSAQAGYFLANTAGVPGVEVRNTAAGSSTEALRISAGVLKFTSSNPATTTGFSNTLTPKNVVKAWVTCHTDGAGGMVLDDGFNVASVNIDSGSRFTINFATAMGNTLFSVVVLGSNLSGEVLACTNKTTTTARIDVAAEGKNTGDPIVWRTPLSGGYLLTTANKSYNVVVLSSQ